MPRQSHRTSTATSSFGAGRREGHDASAFYARFTSPELSDDDSVATFSPANPFVCADASHMAELPDNSVALVVTSPPYFVGKEYEQALGEGHVPATYLEYLDMLARVFAECKRVLEPGGRIAVNVANLGRRPYRSLSADVIRILQDDLQLLLRGEVIWVKGKGASGSCAWGSFRQATNPVLRDITERVVIASKGRFNRARPPRQREAEGLPWESTAGADEFLEATLDVWELPAERATRVGHPAPFPVELPLRLIELYTFRGDLVLDPFMGSGSTLVAAARAGRRYIGYDVDPHYVEIARSRVESRVGQSPHPTAARAFAEELLEECGFTITAKNHPLKRLGLDVDLIAEDQQGGRWYFEIAGAFSIANSGLQRADTLWKALGRAFVLMKDEAEKRRVILLTTDLPRPDSAGDAALRAAGPSVIFDVVALESEAGRERLRHYADGNAGQPLAGFWTPEDL